MQILAADRVWDGTSTRPMERGFVGVDDGRVAAVGRRAFVMVAGREAIEARTE